MFLQWVAILFLRKTLTDLRIALSCFEGSGISDYTYPEIKGYPAEALPAFIECKFAHGELKNEELADLRRKPAAYLRNVLKGLRAVE